LTELIEQKEKVVTEPEQSSVGWWQRWLGSPSAAAQGGQNQEDGVKADSASDASETASQESGEKAEEEKEGDESKEESEKGVPGGSSQALPRLGLSAAGVLIIALGM
jgi:hypothetical protein